MSVPLRPFLRELRAAFAFASVAAALAVAGSMAAFNLDVSVVEADIVATDAHVVVAALMPTFFAAWSFFLFRREAWRSPLRAFAIGANVTAAGVFAHDRVLHSHYYDAPSWRLPTAWFEGVVDGIVTPTMVEGTGLMPAYLAAVVGVGIGAALLQHTLTPRSGP